MNDNSYNSPNNHTLIRGKINKVSFSNSASGFTILEVETAESPLTLTVVGTALPTVPGIELLLRGQYAKHPKFGRQFKVAFWEQVAPTGKESMINFLSSGLFPGIGEKKAADIYQRFGDDSYKIIQQQPSRLNEISGIGPKTIEDIQETFGKHNQNLELRRYLMDLGLSTFQIQKIIDTYHEQALDVIKTNPYKLALDLPGFGFARADQIALNTGMELNHPLRLQAGIYFTLVKVQEDGHCYLELEQLYDRVKYLLKTEEVEDLTECIEKLVTDFKIVVEDQKIYLRNIYDAEVFLAKFMQQRASLENLQLDISQHLPAVLEKNLASRQITLSEQQVAALHLAAKQNLLVITGGPGCGKTTLVRSIVEIFQKANRTIKLAAPTGKASQRLSEVCQIPASTIHRLLGFDPIKKTFVHNITNPIRFTEDDLENEQQLDLLIIDEASMIDLLLARDLFSAISPETKLIIVGDQDQLPSVGAGKVLADILASKIVPRIVLNQIFRQANKSAIVEFAHQVNSGIIPEIPVPDGSTTSDVYFIPRKETHEITNLVESLYAEQIPQKFGISNEQIMLLSATNRGPVGSELLNQKLQARINPPENKARLQLGEQYYAIGDRICQRVNNYQIDPDGVFNGDQGVIKDLNSQTGEAIIELWDGRHVRYQKSDLTQISLSYAMTIHRSQGSEIPCVIIVLHESQFVLLDRQLLYTAMTRAKKLLIIVGSKRALQIACQRTLAKRRNTSLTSRIELLHS